MKINVCLCACSLGYKCPSLSFAHTDGVSQIQAQTYASCAPPELNGGSVAALPGLGAREEPAVRPKAPNFLICE